MVHLGPQHDVDLPGPCRPRQVVGVGSPTFIPATLSPARATMGPGIKETTVLAVPVYSLPTLVTFASFDYL